MKIDDMAKLVLNQVQQLAKKTAIDVTTEDAGISRPKNKQHGDYASNIALRLHREFSLSSMELATKLAQEFDTSDKLREVTAVAPGFINFFVRAESRQQVIGEIFVAGKDYGKQPAKNQSVLLEFVSSNPTGPLHVGHGRGAAYGASLANVLRACGYKVFCEYYVNDAGRQMAILTTSLWIRYLQKVGYSYSFPSGGYQGDYLVLIAAKIHEKYQNDLVPDNFDKQSLDTIAETEEQLDQLVVRCKRLLGAQAFTELRRVVTEEMIAVIRQDLETFQVRFDNWFMESSLFITDKLEDVINRLYKATALYNKDGALWFRSQNYGDTKDRVVKRANGEYTYFATDIAYHVNKFERGFDRVINLFGADHHGYTVRLKAAMTALGYDPDRLEICMIQLASLTRGQEKISMSTRKGQFVVLTDLVNETGADAARFFYLMRRHEQHLDFDVALATRQTKDNPVYYVQYAYARVSQIMCQATTRNLIYDEQQAIAMLHTLNDDREYSLMDKLASFPDIISKAANTRSPHIITQYLRELAALFHNYYAGVMILDSKSCWQPRLALLLAVQQVLANGLSLLDVSTHERM